MRAGYQTSPHQARQPEHINQSITSDARDQWTERPRSRIAAPSEIIEIASSSGLHRLSRTHCRARRSSDAVSSLKFSNRRAFGIKYANDQARETKCAIRAAIIQERISAVLHNVQALARSANSYIV